MAKCSYDDSVHNGAGPAFVRARHIAINYKQRTRHRRCQLSLFQRHPGMDLVGWGPAHTYWHWFPQCGRHPGLFNTQQRNPKRPKRGQRFVRPQLNSSIGPGGSTAHMHATLHTVPVKQEPEGHCVPEIAVRQSSNNTILTESMPWEANSSRYCYMMIVTYDGTDFFGYQVQHGKHRVRTVAGELLRVLCTVFQVDAASLSMNVRSSAT